MIRLGLDTDDKQKVVDQYLQMYEIKKVFVFYPEKLKPLLKFNCPAEYVEYADIIMYKFFYRLLEEIDDHVLLIFDECMRKQNRSDLTYNCAHHYCNQTKHKIVFEYFPFIEDSKDFMVLLDFLNKGKYKDKSFDWDMLKGEDIQAKPCRPSLDVVKINVGQEAVKRYEAYKEKLFDNLGNKDPDTIPRQLHIWSGNLKKNHIEPDKKYVARNDRFKLPNVDTYKNAGEEDYILLDFPHRQLDLNDFLKTTGMASLQFISTGLKVDGYYANSFIAWAERIEEFYAKTSLYK